MDKRIADYDGPHLNHTDLYIYQCGAENAPADTFTARQSETTT